MGGAYSNKLSIEEAMLSPETIARAAMTRLREEQGWNLSDLARRLDTTPTQVRKLENGDLKISLDWMQRLARVFDVKMSAFLANSEVEANIDATAQAVLVALNTLPPSERPTLVQSAAQLVLVARRLADSKSGPALSGGGELAEQVADRWNTWTEPQRRHAAEMLRLADNLASR